MSKGKHCGYRAVHREENGSQLLTSSGGCGAEASISPDVFLEIQPWKLFINLLLSRYNIFCRKAAALCKTEHLIGLKCQRDRIATLLLLQSRSALGPDFIFKLSLSCLER